MDGTADGVRAVGRGLLERVDDLVFATLERRADTPGYDALPVEDHARQLRQNALELLERLFVHQELPQAIVCGGEMIEQRVRLGIPREAFVRALVIAGEELWRASVAEASRQGAGPEVLARCGLRVFDWVTAASAHAIDVYRRVEREAARRDDTRRERFLDALLTGDLAGWDVVAESAAHGLVRDPSYTPVLARGDDAEVELLAAASSDGGMVARRGGDAVAILRRVPPLAGSTAGLGPKAGLTALAEPWAEAQRAFDVAVAFGLTGPWSLSQLGSRSAIHGDAATGDRLVARFIDPVRELGAFGEELIDTLDAWLAQRMRLRATARAMPVHVNTLRYRLRRYADITGADLDSAEDLFGIWWAVQREKINPRSMPSSAVRSTDDP